MFYTPRRHWWIVLRSIHCIVEKVHSLDWFMLCNVYFSRCNSCGNLLCSRCRLVYCLYPADICWRILCKHDANCWFSNKNQPNSTAYSCTKIVHPPPPSLCYIWTTPVWNTVHRALLCDVFNVDGAFLLSLWVPDVDTGSHVLDHSWNFYPVYIRAALLWRLSLVVRLKQDSPNVNSCWVTCTEVIH